MNETSETPIEELKGTMNNWGKIQLADHLRLLGDNQRTLDAANRADARARDLHQRVEEARAKGSVEGLATPPPDEDWDPMNIYIDSPVSINQPVPQQPQPPVPSPAPPLPETTQPPASTVASKLATAAKLAAVMAGAGSLPLAGIGLHSLFSGPPEAQQAQVAPDLSGYGVQVEKNTSKEAP